ncbi:hypothetical protein MP638_003709 [Amoeboaphelidium occidentale]|nr:hypothetical protein MP638_003709 [Amoeboaphelidium occidentale]
MAAKNVVKSLEEFTELSHYYIPSKQPSLRGREDHLFNPQILGADLIRTTIQLVEHRQWALVRQIFTLMIKKPRSYDVFLMHIGPCLLRQHQQTRDQEEYTDTIQKFYQLFLVNAPYGHIAQFSFELAMALILDNPSSASNAYTLLEGLVLSGEPRKAFIGQLGCLAYGIWFRSLSFESSDATAVDGSYIPKLLDYLYDLESTQLSSWYYRAKSQIKKYIDTERGVAEPVYWITYAKLLLASQDDDEKEEALKVLEEYDGDDDPAVFRYEEALKVLEEYDGDDDPAVFRYGFYSADLFRDEEMKSYLGTKFIQTDPSCFDKSVYDHLFKDIDGHDDDMNDKFLLLTHSIDYASGSDHQTYVWTKLSEVLDKHHELSEQLPLWWRKHHLLKVRTARDEINEPEEVREAKLKILSLLEDA